MLPVSFDADLVRRYDAAGPRYTSYPTAVEFHPGFGSDQYRTVVELSNADPIPRPLSIYVHIPFCATLCFYCACNKVVTRNRQKAEEYLERLYRETAMQAALFDQDRRVEQIHFGGGTPTFLKMEQLGEVMTVLDQHFLLHKGENREFSIELDPRTIETPELQTLKDMGFNRVSLGVQDFDRQVQQAVNRIQSQAQTTQTIEAARAAGFKSISIDLIYGLPKQTRDSFATTLEKVLEIRPDRISLFNYAHLPARFTPQRRILEEDLPNPDEKLGILSDSVEGLAGGGYQYIGMDHFALPDDPLAVAQREHELYRNFQGYSTHAECDLVGLGVTAIGAIGDSFSQNYTNLDDYYAAIDNHNLAIAKGLQIELEDRLRGQIIQDLMCHFALDKRKIEKKFGIEFDEYFASEQSALETMQADGLVRIAPDAIQVSTPGRFLIRNICMVFDRHLQQANQRRTFSKVL